MRRAGAMPSAFQDDRRQHQPADRRRRNPVEGAAMEAGKVLKKIANVFRLPRIHRRRLTGMRSIEPQLGDGNKG